MKGNIKLYSFLFKQEGTARNERYPDALNPALIPVDDRKLEDFIIYAQRYTKNILFVPATGDVNPHQTWDVFFKDNAVLLTANIATKEASEIKATFESLKQHFSTEPTIANFERIAVYVLSRFQAVDGWHASSAANTALNQDLRMYISSYLGRELKRLDEIISYLYSLSKDRGQFIVSDQLVNKDDIWEQLDAPPISLSDKLFQGNNDEEKLNAALFSLTNIFDTVFHVISNLINNCKHYFDASVYEQQDHPPHIALFIAFIKLYSYAQDALNKLPQKLLNYYYKEVLSIKAKQAVPDTTYIVFEIAKGFNSCAIKQGTKLSAGKDKAGADIIYLTDKDIIINKAQVAAIKSIFIQKNKGGIASYYAATVKSATGYIVTGEKADGSWNPFGLRNQVTNVQVGLGIASTQFYLAKGQRNVWLTLNLQDDFPLDEIDNSLFALRLTGERGWLSSTNDESHITIDYFKKTDINQLQLSFSISIAQPSAIIAFDAGIHKGNYVTSSPVVEILLLFPAVPAAPEPETYKQYITKVNQLNALQAIIVTGAEVKVQVGSIDQKVNFDGVKDLVLQNHESVLDSKKPFMPFTAMPQVGSSFYIGCNDMYYKPIQSLSLNIEWMLPDNFRSYYDKYFPPYDVNKFTASLNILRKQHWQKLDDVSIIDSYANNPKFRSLIIDLQKDTVTEGYDVPEFDVTKYDGTLKLKLNFPDFGHNIYGQLITATVIEKASSKLAMVDFYQIVKKQLQDSVITIKYPDDVGSATGSLRVVIYNVLELQKDDEMARSAMIVGLANKLKTLNGSDVTPMQLREMAGAANSGAKNTTIVNDNNFIERIFRFLRKVKLIDRSIHFDQDKDNVENVVENLGDKLDTKVDFILPADQELVSLILSETNSAISKVVVKIADKLLDLRKATKPDNNAVADVIKKEIDEANEIINDLIARKIATLLSAHDVPPKPYTPLINTLAVSYSSAKKLKFGEDQFFQVLPFGVKEIVPTALFENNGNAKYVDPASSPALFPGYLSGGDTSHSGLLLLGIKDICPGQNLSMLFQVADGTRFSEKKPSALSWWYLVDNEWVTMQDDHLFSDTTYGLQTTGIVEVVLPESANNHNTIFDDRGLHWLAVSVDKNIDAFPDILDIKTQAVSVMFTAENSNTEHLNEPLPAGKIKKLLDGLSGIKSVSQPVPSFNGKMAELEPEYNTRVAERLRHKSRAVNNWDYERLVLEKFPFVYKVKCLNNYKDGEFAVGHVTLVPIVKITGSPAGAAFTEMPLAQYIQLRNIEQYISAKTSAFVKVHALNPQLNYVKISCKVKFRAGMEKGYNLQKLNEDIILYLTSWLAGNHETLSFSSKIYASSIISFIDKRAYVDYVADLSMNQYTLQGGTEIYCKTDNQSTALMETQFTSGHSLLVSAPAHHIQLL